MEFTIASRLRTDIDACGYFPDLVEDSIRLALHGESIVDYAVHHEATFNHDAIQRHLTVLVLTPSRLLIGHTDETDEAEGEPAGGAASSTESIPLGKINGVSLTRIVTTPELYAKAKERVHETWLSLGWGTLSRVDLEPSGCEDPTCEDDHGYTGTSVADDLTVRVSAAADGADAVAALVRFGTSLQFATGQAGRR